MSDVNLDTGIDGSAPADTLHRYKNHYREIENIQIINDNSLNINRFSHNSVCFLLGFSLCLR
jgi:hypothetical protein